MLWENPGWNRAKVTLESSRSSKGSINSEIYSTEHGDFLYQFYLLVKKNTSIECPLCASHYTGYLTWARKKIKVLSKKKKIMTVFSIQKGQKLYVRPAGTCFGENLPWDVLEVQR